MQTLRRVCGRRALGQSTLGWLQALCLLQPSPTTHTGYAASCSAAVQHCTAAAATQSCAARRSTAPTDHMLLRAPGEHSVATAGHFQNSLPACLLLHACQKLRKPPCCKKSPNYRDHGPDYGRPACLSVCRNAAAKCLSECM
jgi:hypothetical protein